VSNAKWRFRDALDSDRDFLFALYQATMKDLVTRTWGWDEHWQQTDFDRRWHCYSSRVIEDRSASLGAVCLEWQPQALYLHELQLLPEHQNRGIGTAVLQALFAEAAARSLPVSLSVLSANSRAQALYRRLGFRLTKQDLPFMLMSR
jgi:ribosomal protein S18 acetylase RimI-like enzyme